MEFLGDVFAFLSETKSAIPKTHLRKKSDLRQRSVGKGVDSRRVIGRPFPDAAKEVMTSPSCTTIQWK